MKFIYILLVVLGSMKVSANSQPQWQNLGEIDLWLQSKDHLEVIEYGNLVNCLEKMRLEKTLGDGNLGATDLFAQELMLRRFVELVNAKEYPKVCEFFEAFVGHSSFKGMMMNALTECEDLEFSARVVHNAMGKGRWDAIRGFEPQLNQTRRNLFNKIVGESNTLEAVYAKYGFEDLDAQKVMKTAIEKKWPQLANESSSKIVNKPINENENLDLLNQKSSEEKSSHSLPKKLADRGGWLSPVRLILFALFIGLVLVICRHYSKL